MRQNEPHPKTGRQIRNFEAILLYKIRNDHEESIYTPEMTFTKPKANMINTEVRTERIFKLSDGSSKTKPTKELEKLHIPMH